MKNWNFKVKSNIQDITEKLDATFGSAEGFVYEIDRDDNNSVAFKLHKRGLYAFYLMFLNKIIVNGKILRTNTEDETRIEISFSQYFLWQLVVYVHLFLGSGLLIAIFSGISSSMSLYLFGGIVLTIGIVLWIGVQKKFEKDIQEYKALISEILNA